MLVVTTSVWMIDWVHSHTSHSWESLAQSLELVEKCTSLHDGLFVSASACNYTNCGSAKTWNGLSGTGWESDSGSASVIRVSNNGGISSWASGISSFITNSRLNIANGGTFRDSVDWKDVSSWYSRLSAGEDVLSAVSSFSGKEVLSVVFVFVRVSEIDFNEWTSTSWIVKDSSDNALDVAFSFDEIEVSISWWGDSFWFWSGVNTTDFAFSLAPDNFTH